MKRVQAQDKSHHHVWKLHSENAPPEVLSIRSFIGHMGAKDPLQGNRLVTQALIKFDTNQVCELPIVSVCSPILTSVVESSNLQLTWQTYRR